MLYLARRKMPALFGGAAPLFSPLDISGLVAWYDFSDATTLFTDSARTTLVTADADPIGGVADKSGGAKHLSSSGAARPAYKTNIKNSRAVSRYDGTNHYLTLSSLALNSKHILAVVKNTSSGAGDQVLLGHSGGSYTIDFSVSGRLLENGGPTSANSSWSPNNWYVVELASEASVEGRFFVNGNDVSSTTSYTAQSITQLSGRLNTNNIVWQGDIAEVLIYSHKLSASEILLARNYLNNKWAVY